jgi:uncharacterized protein (TIGR02145 family)
VYGTNNVFTTGDFTTAERKVYNNGYYNSTSPNYQTACGPIASKSDSYNTTCNKYTSPIGQEASTTGNMYGVYDMAGGAYDQVQANMGAASVGSSGISIMPQTRYMDIYYVPPFGTRPTSSNSNEYLYNLDNCTQITCGGHGIFEAKTQQAASSSTSSWGSDYSYFAESTRFQFLRGGITSTGSQNGIWGTYTENNSTSIADEGSRTVMQRVGKVSSIVAQEGQYLSVVVANNNITTMQALTSQLCQASIYDDAKNVTNNTVTLADIRNNQQYQVRKLPDGNCWMINNLRITPADVGNAPANQTQAGANLTSLASVGAADNTASSGTNSSPKWYDATCGVSGAPSTGCGSTDITSTRFYGYHYNYCAATGASSSTCGNLTADTNATTSICPAGWRLPTGGAISDFSYLNGMMAGDGTYSTASDNNHGYNWLDVSTGLYLYKGTFSGNWDPGGKFADFGAGRDWSSTAKTYYSAYISFHWGNVHVDGDSGSFQSIYGATIRCLVN